MLKRPSLVEPVARLEESFGCYTVDYVVHFEPLLDPRKHHNTFSRIVMDSWDVVVGRGQLKTLDWNTIELASCCDFWVYNLFAKVFFMCQRWHAWSAYWQFLFSFLSSKRDEYFSFYCNGSFFQTNPLVSQTAKRIHEGFHLFYVLNSFGLVQIREIFVIRNDGWVNSITFEKNSARFHGYYGGAHARVSRLYPHADLTIGTLQRFLWFPPTFELTWDRKIGSLWNKYWFLRTDMLRSV